MKYLLAALVVLSQISCDTDKSFYNDSYREDLSRVPLIKPYELINPFKDDFGRDKAWNLNFKRDYTTKQNLKDNFVNVTLINIEDSIIYGKSTKTNYPNFSFIIDTKKDQELIFEDENQWEEKLKSLNLNKNNLHEIWPLFYEFRDHDKLPWKRPINKSPKAS